MNIVRIMNNYEQKKAIGIPKAITRYMMFSFIVMAGVLLNIFYHAKIKSDSNKNEETPDVENANDAETTKKEKCNGNMMIAHYSLNISMVVAGWMLMTAIGYIAANTARGAAAIKDWVFYVPIIVGSYNILFAIMGDWLTEVHGDETVWVWNNAFVNTVGIGLLFHYRNKFRVGLHF